jgi:FlaA1/EpsC-like NDP-sugar epimerase
MTPQRAARRAMYLTLGFDLSAAAAAMVLSNVLFWWTGEPRGEFPVSSTLLSTVCFTAAVATGFLVLRIQTQVWRHIGWPDAVRIMQAIALSGLIFLPIAGLLNGALSQPWGILLTALLIWTISLFTGRMVALSRSTRKPLQIFSPDRPGCPADPADRGRAELYRRDTAPADTDGDPELPAAGPDRYRRQ